MADMEKLYQERLKRYTTAMRNGKPDRIPIRPFAAEFIATATGTTCQEVTQDFSRAFDATLKCCQMFDWDATVANMVYVWGGLAQAAGLKYYAIPGVGLGPNTGFQYLEPPEENAWMQPDEYDALAEDPTGFLYNVWLPRVSTDVVAPGEPNTFRNNVSLVKGGMAMLSYFGSFPAQIERMRREAGTVSAIAGILKAPFDILADKLRGYTGLCMDLIEQPKKVMKACEALMPHLLHVALTSADPSKTVPIGFWMHRGCVPFISQRDFDEMFWPTLKPILQELWKRGHQVLFYAEGKWGAHLKTFAELPEGSIIYHVDRDDIFEVHKVLHHKFCISGGIPNHLLAFGKADEVRAYCRKVIEAVGRDGGYIMDASAIMQNDTTVENMRALVETTREYGTY
jgi:uroporphyrinogen-III decarboxylase